MQPPSELSENERLLWEAFPRGEQVDLQPQEEIREGTDGKRERKPGHRIRADIIAQLLHTQVDPTPGKIVMLHLRAAHITGRLELQYSKLACPVIFEDCSFDLPINLSHSNTATISFQGSRLNALNLEGAVVNGDLNCVNVEAKSVTAHGAQISGQLWMNNARLLNKDGFALDAPDMTVSGGMYCRDGFRAEGGVNLWGASIGSNLEFVDATLSNSDGHALRGQHLTVKADVDCSNGFRSIGLINLFGAQIGGQLWMSRAHLANNQDYYAFSAPQIKIAGGMYCRGGFRAEGGVNLWGASIGAGLEFNGAILNYPQGHALRAPHLTVMADVSCANGFTAIGNIDLTSSRIYGRLSFRGAALAHPGFRLDCADARIGTLDLQSLTAPPAKVDLHGSEIKVIHDDPACWPLQLHLGMASYDFLQPHLPPEKRVELLRLDPSGYQPGPYEQLAAYYRRIGHDDEARTVLLAKERNRREKLGPAARIWSHLQDVIVGFGYRPTRAFAWFITLVAIMSTYFAIDHPMPIDAAKAPTLQPVAYSMDLLLPILDLGQEKAHTLIGAARWLGWTATLIGWILATTIIAGIMRVVARK